MILYKYIPVTGAAGAVKRAFVSSHQLQQQRNWKKIPRSPQMQDLPQVLPVNTRGNAKRKLELHKDSNVEVLLLSLTLFILIIVFFTFDV